MVNIQVRQQAVCEIGRPNTARTQLIDDAFPFRKASGGGKVIEESFISPGISADGIVPARINEYETFG